MADKVKEKLNRSGNKRGLNPNSVKNLHSGRKGNNYSAKDYSITRIIKGMLDDPVPERWLETEDKANGMTWRQAIAKRILIDAVRGNTRATCELLDRLEGKVTQPISGEGGGPVRYEISVKDAETRELTNRLINGGAVVSNISLS